jgi:hypothetical protein
MENPGYEPIEKLPPKTRTKIRKMIASLRKEFGESFDIEETSDEYVVTQGGYKTRISKIAKVMHEIPNVDAEEEEQKDTWALKDLLEAQIRFPELEDSGKQMERLKELRESKKPQK